MHLFFDLDGTLTDSKVGITNSMNYALAKFGLPQREPPSLECFIGASAKQALGSLLGTDDAETLTQAVSWYRERYFVEGWLENTVYDGIPEFLHVCREAGHQLYIATSKRHDIAERVLTHFHLAPYFTAIYGCDVDLSKAELLSNLLQTQYLTPTDCWMIGDREHDIAAGQANGVSTVGVLWGYGTQEELTIAGADYLVETPFALQHLILEHNDVTDSTGAW